MARWAWMLPAVLAAAECGAEPNLVQNPGFARGTTGWSLVAGPYGAGRGGGQGRARVAIRQGYGGGPGLLLDAVGLASEVDAYSVPVPVQGGHGYRLGAWVRLAHDVKSYKVTVDWQDAGGKHLGYANDWAGNDRPTKWVRHGGIFAAPTSAARAVVILGTQPGGACQFDEVTLEHVGVSEPLEARSRRDGDGTLSIDGPTEVPAGGYGTWHARYTCGSSGLPAGGLVALRRSPWNTDWSDPQGTRPGAEGYVRVVGPPGSSFGVERGAAGVLLVRLMWPTLMPGDRVEIIVGDRSGGSPGMRVQRKPGKLRWHAGSDCTGKGDYLDLARTDGGAFEVYPGAPVRLRVMMPAVMAVGEPYGLRVEAVDRHGNVVQPRADQVFAPSLGGIEAHPAAEPQTGPRQRVARFVCVARREGAVVVRAAQGAIAGSATARATAPWLVPAVGLPGQVTVREATGATWVDNGRVGLVLPRSAMRWGGLVLYANRGGEWVRVAATPALASVQDRPGRWLASGPVPGVGATFGRPVVLRQGKGVRITMLGAAAGSTVAAVVTLAPGSQCIGCRVTATPPARAGLGALHSPLLGVGDGAGGDFLAGGLLPGVEFLAPGESSSDVSGVAWAIHERRIPDPYKITVPLMAASTGGCVAGVAWDPTQRWDGVSATPLARFEVPNPRQANHLLSLALPGRRQGGPENVVASAGGKRVRGPWTLAFELFALPGTTDPAAAVDWWVHTHPLPRVRHPRPWAAESSLCAEALTRSCWVESVSGWFTAVGLKPGYVPDYVYRMAQMAAAMEDRGMAAVVDATAGRAVAAVGGPAGIGPQMLMGDPAKAVAGLREAAYDRMAQQRPDGGWAFGDVYGRQGARATLADPDDQETGSCVTALEPVVTYAAATGDPSAVAAAIRGLTRLSAFSKPAGAESWEVPFACPNLRAAAMACRCYLRGYQLTGQPEYLERARRWAYGGLGFVALTQAADRPVMPGATISVMGTTYYDQGWFGWPVQWVGLVYAEVLQEFAPFDTSLDWMRVAELILASAERQQKTADAVCKHVGMYPDSYSLLTGRDSYEWCLGPSGIVGVLLGARGFACEPRVLAIGRPGAMVRGFSTAAQVGAGSYADGTVTVHLRSPAGSAAGVILYGVGAPLSVSWQGRPLAGAPAGAAGWRASATERAVILRLPFADDEGDLVLRGVSPVPYQVPRLAEGLANGGFEDGAAGWALEPGASVVANGTAYEGKQALLSDSRDGTTEGQATSVLFGVQGGGHYRLSSMVRLVEGGGDYKVTLEWVGVGGRHLRYDNDWAGSNRPSVYTRHGGDFTAPAGAIGARVILGSRRCRCLFDGISLERVP